MEAARDDAALLQAYAGRDDRQAMNLLFARHADAAYRVALRCCRNSADAEDAVQTAFIEVLRHAAKYRGASAVRSWIFGFVVNACRHKKREEGRRARREERAASNGELHLPERELHESLRSAVQGLPEHYRLPVWLHYCEGLSSGEVAETLSLSENTVRSQVSRGLEELRAVLAPAGLAVAGVSLSGTLAALATESAPASLTASLSGITTAGPGLAAAKAGFLAKVSAGGVAAAALLSTAAALWWGELPEDPRPPEFARVDRQVAEWQPVPEERRFDEIGWVQDLDEALRLSREHRRPVFLVTHVGRLGTGRTDGGSMALREGPLSRSGVIDTLNTRFVPAYLRSGDAHPGLRRIVKEAGAAGLLTGSEVIYFLDPESGLAVDAIHMCKADVKVLEEKFRRLQAPEAGPVLKAPAPQSRPPVGEKDGLVLHVTARYLDEQGGVTRKPNASYHSFPAEEWLELGAKEASAWAPPGNGGPGTVWEIDPAVTSDLLARLYPLTGNYAVTDKSVLQKGSLKARVLAGRRSTAWIRLEGSVRFNHAFFPGKDERVVEADLGGYVEYDRIAGRVRALRLVTEQAAYGRERFGVALRSVP